MPCSTCEKHRMSWQKRSLLGQLLLNDPDVAVLCWSPRLCYQSLALILYDCPIACVWTLHRTVTSLNVLFLELISLIL